MRTCKVSNILGFVLTKTVAVAVRYLESLLRVYNFRLLARTTAQEWSQESLDFLSQPADHALSLEHFAK